MELEYTAHSVHIDDVFLVLLFFAESRGIASEFSDIHNLHMMLLIRALTQSQISTACQQSRTSLLYGILNILSPIAGSCLN